MSNDDPFMDEDQVADAVSRYFEESPELLEGMVPSHDLWPAIENRISARVLPLEARSSHAHGRRRSLGWVPMLIAASALVATSAGVTYVLTARGARQGSTVPPIASAIPDTSRTAQSISDRPTVTGAGSALAANTTDSIEEEKQGRERPLTRARRAPSQLASHPALDNGDAARKTYDTEIATLHDALEARRGQLNPSTVAIIEQNLRVIDEAIRQSKAALAKDPHSRLLNDQLDRTLATKTGLLRAAALLPAA